MGFEMEESFLILFASASDSFVQVTVFVAAALLVFGYIDYRNQGEFVAFIEKSKKFQPVLGALLGLTPGCGGAIFIMPLFVKGSVSFGTVVATLIATAGDSAFLTISKVPLTFLAISAVSFVAAVLTGFLVDRAGLGEKLRLGIKHMKPAVVHEKHDSAASHSFEGLHHIGHSEGDEIDILLHHTGHGVTGLAQKLTHRFFWVFWVLAAIGLVFGVGLLMGIESKYAYGIGVAGTLTSIAVTVLSRKFLRDDTHEESEHKLMSIREMFIHNAIETSFVGTWVFVAYAVYAFAAAAVGGDAVILSWMTSAGLASVFVGVLIGLIPGCGPQILFVSLYLKGVLPFAAVVANAVSQDGDALFPLLAIDRRSAWYASLITTIPALAVGLIFYYLS